MEATNQTLANEINPENLPTLSRRFQSLLIDQVFIILCMLIFSLLLQNTDNGSTSGLRGFLLLGLFLVYEPFCIAFCCTVGNYLSGIRVRKFGEEQKRISLFNSYLRFIVKMLLGIISFFTVTSNNSKQGIHDMAAGSVMIYNVRN
jgi:uncharacterized RDD family membrane protein YckC